MRHIRDQLTDRQVITTGAVSVALMVSALACGLTIGSGQASASQVSCGDTITADTTLHHDLVNCPNNGIIIGADDITLDLNGHTIDGDGTEAVGCNRRKEFCDEGLPNFGHDGVTVMHGSVRDFAVGPEVAKARHVRLLDISSTSHVFFGAVVFKSARSVIRN